MFNFTTGQKTRQQSETEIPAKDESKTPVKRELDPQMEARIDEIEKQRLEFSRKNPDFDMKKEMENPDFVNYVWGKGLTVEEAYFLVHREEILEQSRQEATDTLLERKKRMVENGAGKNRPAIAKKNPKDLSDKEVDDIIERVRRGEKVSF